MVGFFWFCCSITCLAAPCLCGFLRVTLLRCGRPTRSGYWHVSLPMPEAGRGSHWQMVTAKQIQCDS